MKDHTPDKSDLRPIVLADLFADLLWPKLLRAGVLALRPGRMAIALVAVVLTGLIGNIRLPLQEGLSAASLWDRATAMSPGVPRLEGAVSLLSPLAGIVQPMLTAWQFVWSYPLAALVAGLPIAIVLVFATGAIARMAACETAHGVMMPMRQGAVFAASLWRSLAAVFLVPAIIVLGIVVVQMLAGAVLLRWPVVSVLGAMLFFMAIIGSALVVFMAACFLFGWPMLVPAVACEGGASAGDGIDAAQRVFAYVVASPLRLVAYVSVLVLQLSLLLFVFDAIADGVVGVSVWSTTALLPEEAAALVRGERTGEGAPALSGVTAALLQYWKAVPAMVVQAFTLSFVASGGTILYLLLRRLNDGQNESEIWEPGMIPGTISGLEATAEVGRGTGDAR